MSTPKLYKLILLGFCYAAASCSDFVEVKMPDDQITNRSVFRDDATAKSAMNGLYIELSQDPVFTNSAVQILTGLSSDELRTSLPDYLQFEENDLTSDNARLLPDLWKPAYRFIYVANSILEGLNQPTNIVSSDLRKHLEGEARFIRAYTYFYLVNLFGNVPLVIGTNLNVNDAISRSPINKIYELINSDLSIARTLLPSEYPVIGDHHERIKVTSWAALALQSKVDLYQKNWASAESLASELIDNGMGLFNLTDIENIFKSNSTEAIWQIQPVRPGLGTWEANIYITQTGVPAFTVSNQILNAFEPGDKRRYAWLDSIESGTSEPYYYPHKYTAPLSKTEYHIALRLSDVILIRAEARAQRDDYNGACDDIDLVRNRAGLPSITRLGINRTKLLQAVEQERMIEFLSEGSRWFDLKRQNLAEQSLGNVSYKKWRDTDALYPVPKSEIEQNTNLMPQNDGY